MSTGRVFWVDTDYDRANASNGVSRFAAYLRRAERQFAGAAELYDDPTGPLAAQAWNTACPPVMSPGYVAWHPRVQSARAEHDADTGELLVTVEVTSNLPEPVARAAGWSWLSWQYAAWAEHFSYPELRQAGHKALLPTLTAQVLIEPGRVLSTLAGQVPDWRELAAAVDRLCGLLNTELGPIVDALYGGERR